MSRELNIRTALKTALAGITLNGNPVKFYDMVRDDVEAAHIYTAMLHSEYRGNKSKDLYNVTLHLNISETLTAMYSGKENVDDIGQQIETILKTDLVITGHQTVIQYLEGVKYVESAKKNLKEIIKVYIYTILIEDNG